MIRIGTDEKVWTATKPATFVHALAVESVSAEEVLSGTHLNPRDLVSPDTKVSLNQIILCCRNAARLSRDPFVGFRTGGRFHLSSYGMYGFAILCSTDFRQTMRFAEKYHHLAAPVTDIAYSEQGGRSIWTVDVIAHPMIDTKLYRFLLELQFGIHTSLNRDIMGSNFVPLEFHFRYEPLYDIAEYREAFGCEVKFQQPQNRMIWDAAWMDRRPEVGNDATYAVAIKLCDKMLEELHLQAGIAGKVRQALISNLMHETSLERIARHLNYTARTLRRKLQEEQTSFRQLADELKMQVAIKYLRDTEMTIEEIASALGFSDTAGFRRAFRRWTLRRPLDFKGLAIG